MCPLCPSWAPELWVSPWKLGAGSLFLLGTLVDMISGFDNELRAQPAWTGGGQYNNWFNPANWSILSALNRITLNVPIGGPSPPIADGNLNLNSLAMVASGLLIHDKGLNFNFELVISLLGSRKTGIPISV